MGRRRQKVAMLHRESAPFPPPEYTTPLSKGLRLQARLLRLQHKETKAQKAARSIPPGSGTTAVTVPACGKVRCGVSGFTFVLLGSPMDRDRVIKNLIRAAKNAMKQCAPTTDGINWQREGAWGEL